MLPVMLPLLLQMGIFLLLHTPLGQWLVIPIRRFPLASAERATLVERLRLSKDFLVMWSSVTCSWGMRTKGLYRFTLLRRLGYRNSFQPVMLVEVRDGATEATVSVKACIAAWLLPVQFLMLAVATPAARYAIVAATMLLTCGIYLNARYASEKAYRLVLRHIEAESRG